MAGRKITPRLPPDRKGDPPDHGRDLGAGRRPAQAPPNRKRQTAPDVSACPISEERHHNGRPPLSRGTGSLLPAGMTGDRFPLAGGSPLRGGLCGMTNRREASAGNRTVCPQLTCTAVGMRHTELCCPCAGRTERRSGHRRCIPEDRGRQETTRPRLKAFDGPFSFNRKGSAPSGPKAQERLSAIRLSMR